MRTLNITANIENLLQFKIRLKIGRNWNSLFQIRKFQFWTNGNWPPNSNDREKVITMCNAEFLKPQQVFFVGFWTQTTYRIYYRKMQANEMFTRSATYKITNLYMCNFYIGKRNIYYFQTNSSGKSWKEKRRNGFDELQQMSQVASQIVNKIWRFLQDVVCIFLLWLSKQQTPDI